MEDLIQKIIKTKLPPLKRKRSVEITEISKEQREKILEEPIKFFDYLSWEIDSPYLDFYSEEKGDYIPLETDPWVSKIYDSLKLNQYSIPFTKDTNILILNLPINSEHFMKEFLYFKKEINPRDILERMYNFYQEPVSREPVYRKKDDEKVKNRWLSQNLYQFRKKFLKGFTTKERGIWEPDFE